MGGDRNNVGALEHAGVMPAPEWLTQDGDRLSGWYVEEDGVAGAPYDVSCGSGLEAPPRVT